MRSRFFMALVAALSIGVIGQAQQQQAPRDDGYRSTHVPKSLPTSPDAVDQGRSGRPSLKPRRNNTAANLRRSSWKR